MSHLKASLPRPYSPENRKKKKELCITVTNRELELSTITEAPLASWATGAMLAQEQRGN